MNKKNIMKPCGTLKVNQSYIGETIEQKVERVTISKEPIEDTATTIYTERKKGVLPEYNVRTDRFEVALDAMDKVHKTNTAKRMEIIKDNTKDNGETESVQANISEK